MVEQPQFEASIEDLESISERKIEVDVGQFAFQFDV